jgi:hypothetical protein
MKQLVENGAKKQAALGRRRKRHWHNAAEHRDPRQLQLPFKQD